MSDTWYKYLVQDKIIAELKASVVSCQDCVIILTMHGSVPELLETAACDPIVDTCNLTIQA